MGYINGKKLRHPLYLKFTTHLLSGQLKKCRVSVGITYIHICIHGSISKKIFFP
jgi:hypothetical protein